MHMPKSNTFAYICCMLLGAVFIYLGATDRFGEALGNYILMAVGLACFVDALARLGVVATRSVPGGLILLGRLIALALDGHHVEQFRAFDLLERLQRADQLGQVVSVDGTEVAEIQTLEEVAVVE